MSEAGGRIVLMHRDCRKVTDQGVDQGHTENRPYSHDGDRKKVEEFLHGSKWWQGYMTAIMHKCDHCA